jgi:hypothetical protein
MVVTHYEEGSGQVGASIAATGRESVAETAGRTKDFLASGDGCRIIGPLLSGSGDDRAENAGGGY